MMEDVPSDDGRRESGTLASPALGNASASEALAALVQFEIDLASHTVWLSNEALHLIGLEADRECLELSECLTLIHEGDREWVKTTYRRCVATGEAMSIQLRVVRPDGDVRRLRLAATVTQWPDGRARLDGSILDVTAEWKSEKRLREAQRIAKLGSWELDIVTGVFDWSEEIFRILEHPPEALRATYEDLFALVHPEDREMLERARVRALEYRELFELEYRLMMPYGRIKWVRVRGQTEYDAAGQPIRMIGTMQDVTDRAHAAAALHRSELRYRRIVTEAVEGIFEADSEGILIDVNPAFARMLGYASPGDMIGESLRAQFVRNREYERLRSALGRNERQLGTAVRWRTRGDELLDVELFVNTVRDEHSQVVGHHGIARDVTEETQRAAAMQVLTAGLARLTGQNFLDEAAAKLASLLGADGVVIGLERKDGKRGLRVLACHTGGKVHRPRELPIEGTLVASVVAQGAMAHAVGARACYPDDGLLAHAEAEGAVAVPLMDPNGRPIGAVAVTSRHAFRHPERVQAVTGLFALRIAAELEREAADARFSAVFQHAPDAILMVDRDGRMVEINRMAEKTFGYTTEQMTRLTVEDLVPESYREAHKSLRSSFSESGKPRLMGADRSRLFARRADSTTFPVEISLSPIQLGTTWLVVVVVRDLTQRVALEQVAARQQRLEAIGTLAGGVAHDLNNALGPILMVADALRHDPADAAGLLDALETSARRAAGMVRQLLSFAKGGQGERVPIRLPPLVREMESIIASSFPKSVRLTTRIAHGVPPVMGDSTALHQVLLNLCVNARDAIADGGDLAIELESGMIPTIPFGAFGGDAASPGRYVVLRVSDSGSGIAPEMLERVFDPFYTTKGPEQGTGLGLATVLGIVRAHAGFVTVSTTPGSGSTFAVHLPALREEGDFPASVSSEPSAMTSGATILYVDDEAPIRKVAAVVLRRLGYTTITAADGSDALAIVQQRKGELKAIVTDLAMPRLDGPAFIRAVRRILPDIPVVATSGRLDDAVESDLRAMGVEVILQKPFNQSQLLDAVGRVLGGARELDA